MKTVAIIFLSALSMLTTLVLVGCDVQSADTVIRGVDINVAGVYRREDGNLVDKNSGRPVVQMDLRQNGDRLEGIDNNNIIFRGNIGGVNENQASFTLNGNTTLGNEAVISGTITVDGNVGVMRGTWIEDTLFSTVLGSALGPSVNTNRPSPTNSVNLAISPPGPIPLRIGERETFTASGGGANYSWTLSNGTLGNLSALQGAQVTYTATQVGSNIVRVSSGGSQVSVSIIQSAASQ